MHLISPMYHFSKYLSSFCGLFLVLFLYISLDSTIPSDDHPIDVTELNDNLNIQASTSTQVNHAKHPPHKKQVFSHHKRNRKVHHVKLLSFEAVLNTPIQPVFPEFHSLIAESIYIQSYHYLYFEEINPPPPESLS